MKNKRTILDILKTEDFANGAFLRIGENTTLSTFVGKSETGLFSFDYRGNHKPKKLSSQGVIEVIQFRSPDGLYLRFSLKDNAYLEYFSTFCQDLLNGIQRITNEQLSYNTLCDRFNLWKRLFKSNDKLLGRQEIMGLIGELLFLRDHMLNNYPENVAIDSWKGPDKTHKDFSIKDNWYEIKAVSIGKPAVTISSIEQLDSDTPGELVVYFLEEMSPQYYGININKLVSEIMSKLNESQRDIFQIKLENVGFTIRHEYNEFIFELKKQHRYKVTAEFPKLSRNQIPLAITKIKYDIILSDIKSFKI